MIGDKQIHLGFEVGTDKPVSLPLRNLAITGQTQESGKTTTLEALAGRSGATVLTFITKRGEGAFESGAYNRVRPYFRDRADWQFVDAIMAAALGEQNKFLRQFLIPICRLTRTLGEVQEAVRAAMPKAHGQRAGALVQLDAYLELIVPEIQAADLAPTLDLRRGLNVMDVRESTTPMQMLFVQSAIDWVNEHCRDTIVVIPEAWEFIPEGKGSPVKKSAVALVRKGSGIGNRIWVDSQDMAGVDKVILRGCPVWLVGVQREANEIKRNLANIPPPTGRPKAGDVAMLERGQFFACFGTTLVKVYVQPEWMEWDDARAIAMGMKTIREVPIPQRMPKRGVDLPKERQVDEKEARALRAANEQLTRQVADLQRQLQAALGAASPMRPPASPTIQKGEDPGSHPLDDITPRGRVMDAVYAEVKRRAEADPGVLALLQKRPEIELTVIRSKIEMSDDTLSGRVAGLIVSGFFKDGTTASAAHTELQRLGRGSAKPNVYRECDKLAALGFLTKEPNGYREVAGMKINIIRG